MTGVLAYSVRLVAATIEKTGVTEHQLELVRTVPASHGLPPCVGWEAAGGFFLEGES